MSERLTVALGARSYDIEIGEGLLARAGEVLAGLTRGHVPVVTDETVHGLFYARLAERMEAAGLTACPIIIPPGEASKSFRNLEAVVEAILAVGVDRGGVIAALGGGVVGDLAGFAAAIVKRGVGLVQFPTTLLSQVDSSVGGKTGINTTRGKNLVGAFHQPRHVLIDIATLATLPGRELRSGYAEIVKYGALGDPAFFGWLEGEGIRALALEPGPLTRAIAHACRMKAAFVARDEREAGERALLNLGHTFGHALEAATGYSDRLLHGEAVAIGMVLAFRLSARLKLCQADDAVRVARHLENAGLPTSLDDIPGGRPDADRLYTLMGDDKKARDGRIAFILAKGIGRAFALPDVPRNDVLAVLRA